MVLEGLIHSLDRQQIRPFAGIVGQATAHVATAFATHRRPKPRTIAGGWFVRITRGAADPLPQARQLCRHGADLGVELRILLSQSQDKFFGISRP